MSDKKRRFNPKPLLKEDKPASDSKKKRPSGKKRQESQAAEKPAGDVAKKKRPRPSAKKGSSRGGQKNRSDTSVKNPVTASQKPVTDKLMRINKYIAHSGFCSRREADEYVTAGKVKVNGKKVTEPGTKVNKNDKVEVDGQKLSLEPFVYILLNKKSGTITTTDDEKDRNTVMGTIEDATGYRVYPVGRLDRKTMGLLILTNDGDLAHRLMHPSYQVKKTYLVVPNRPLTDEELMKLQKGVDLEDGFIKPDLVQKVQGDSSKILITVFEGRNHLIRRMIEHIGAVVDKLKRIQYAGLVEKDLRVGRWRYLEQHEINDLRKLVKLQPLDFNKNN